MRYRFADFVLDLRRGTLTGPAGAVHLRPQTFKLLEVLITRAPEMVGHEELLDRVWGTQHLSPSSLKQAISEVRQALGDPHDLPHFIETVHRRGYRFIAAVEVLADKRPPSPPPAGSGSAVKLLTLPAPAERSAAPAERSAAAAPASAAASGAQRLYGRRPGDSGATPLLLPLSQDRRITRWLSATFLLTLAFFALWRHYESLRKPALPSAAGPRQVAAVLGFVVPTGPAEASWVPTAVAELLAVELASGGSLQVVAGDEVARLERELHIGPGSGLDPRALERIRAYLGCDLILEGSLRLDREAVGLDLVLVDSLSGKRVFTESFDGRLGDLAALARQVAVRLRQTISPPLLPEEESGGPRWQGADPSRALRLYGQGLDKLRLGEAVTARDLLLEASRLDPHNALVFRALASAYRELGYRELESRAAQRAVDLAGGLPRELRLEIEGQLQLAKRDYPEAVSVYGALHRFFPDDLDHGLQLAAVLVKTQQPGPAAEVLAQLRSLPPPRGDHPAIDLQEVAIYDGNNPQRALEAARSAVRKASARGALQLVALGRREEGWILFRLNRYEEALAALNEAEAIFRAAGDLAKVATVLSTRATVDSVYFNRARAKATFEEALRICREIGNPGTEAQVLNNFAAWSGTDDIVLSGALLRRSLELKQQLGDRAGEALTRLNLANFFRYQGQLSEAREMTVGALELYRQLGDKFRIAFALRTLGSLLAKEGRPEEAEVRFAEALQLSQAVGDGQGEANALFELGNLRLLRQDEEGALIQVRQSREIFERLGMFDDAAISALQVGDILWASGDREAAKAIYRELAAQRARISSERALGMLDQRLESGPPPDPVPPVAGKLRKKPAAGGKSS